MNTFWDKIVSPATVISLTVGLFLTATGGVWYASEFVSRVSITEARLAQLEIRLNEDQKVISGAIIVETKISTQIDALKDLIDRLLTREDEHERELHNRNEK